MVRFLTIAFAVTWGAQLAIPLLGLPVDGAPALALLLVGGFGPTLAAFACGGPARGPRPRPLAVLGLLVPSAIGLLAGGSFTGAPDLLAATLPPLGEEPGWRGFAQPRLVARLGRPAGLVVLGLVWGLWHLPTVFVFGGALADFPGFVAQTAAASIWVSWLYERAGLVGALAAHAGLNLGLVRGGAPLAGRAVWLLVAAALLVIPWYRGRPRRRGR